MTVVVFFTGSLAKGTESHVSALIDCQIVDVMLALVSNPSTDKRLVEIALSVLRSIFQHPLAPIAEINTNTNFLKDIIGNYRRATMSRHSLAWNNNQTKNSLSLRHSNVRQFHSLSVMCGEYFSTIVSFVQRTNDLVSHRCYSISGEANHNRLFNSTNSRVKMSRCNVFYESSGFGCCLRIYVSVDHKFNLPDRRARFSFSFSYENKQLPDILTALLSRVKLSDIQLAAARCNYNLCSRNVSEFSQFVIFYLPLGLTYIHRSDSLTSTDPRIVYRTLPCLARLCTNEFDEETRATAAETLAYLAEVMIHPCTDYKSTFTNTIPLTD